MAQHSLQYYDRVFRVLRPLARLFLRTRFRLQKSDLPELPEKYIMVTNHVTNLDPIIIGTLIKRQSFFVATEHLFSLGFVSRLLISLFAPIPRPKGGQAAGAVMEVLRRVKDGGSVTLFAEGNCSWDGQTASFPAATGKMIRAAGAALVTVRLEGGYLAFPRWADRSRRGPVGLTVAGIYPAETLKAMKPQEINDLIARDIGFNVYDFQAKTGARYPGKKLAESIEHALLLCPACGRFDPFTSRGDVFSCPCGLTARYDDTGHIRSEMTSLATMIEWDRWQKEQLNAMPLDKLPSAKDTDMILRKIDGHERSIAAAGELHFDTEALTLGEARFPTEEIADMAVRLKGTVTFSLRDGSYFEIRKKNKKSGYHGRKYMLLYQAMQQKRSEQSSPNTAQQ